jgi:hypothetical protein
MSTLLYESLTTAREVTPSGLAPEVVSGPEVASLDAGDKATPAKARTKIPKFLDILTALVPVEVLAAHAFLLGAVSQTTNPDDKGPVVMTITDEAWASRFWIGLLIAAALFYAIPHLVKHGWDTADYFRALIPAAAFAAWTMVEKATLFDALFDWDNVMRIGIGVGLALAALIGSKALADKAQEKTPEAEQVAAVAG